jgi:N-methylhydantoinase A
MKADAGNYPEVRFPLMYRLGVDVGGTFTDVLLFDEGTGRLHRTKVPSTPLDQSEGIEDGTRTVLAAADARPSEIRQFLHGTTVATNAMLERKGARVGLLVTTGYRQVLHIARSYVPGGLGGWIVWDRPESLVDLEDVFEIDGRIDARGNEVSPLDGEAVRRGVAALVSRGVEAIAIMFVNAYVNTAHEEAAAQIAAQEAPSVPVSVSSRILPEMGEYDRALTTVANGYVRPTMASYLDSLTRRLAEIGIGGERRVLRSDGGLTAFDRAGAVPVNLLMSGPAGGVAAATTIGPLAGYDNLLTLDMGGTSTDVALIENGRALVRRDTAVGDLTVRAPAIDVATVGAGGGSIAVVPELTRGLRVGPESAGAVPGPAAYGRGGTQPTVSDANVVLGCLPHSLLGGRMQLDRDAARAAVADLARQLSVSVEDAAAAVIDLVNEGMLGALRIISVQRGYDPRDFALFVFGGAGPLHGNALANLLGSWPVVVPPSPGVLCAFGDASTTMRAEYARSMVRRTSEVDLTELRAAFAELAARVDAELQTAGINVDQRELHYEADVRYLGQGFELSVRLEPEGSPLDAMAAEFDEAHRRLFGFTLDDEREIMTVRVIGTSTEPPITPPELPEGDTDASGARLGSQRAYLDRTWVDAGLYDRSALKAGNVVPGPAIIVEMDSTTLVLPGCSATVDRFANLVIRPNGGGSR